MRPLFLLCTIPALALAEPAPEAPPAAPAAEAPAKPAPEAPRDAPSSVPPSGTPADSVPAGVAAAPKPASPPVASQFATTFYGFLQADFIADTTQSFAESAGNGAVARPDSYAGRHGRFQASARHSRLGFRLAAPALGRVKPSAQIEADFLGNQPPNATEAATYVNASVRLRHFFVRVETPWVDVIAGQTWQLFGWQPNFAPGSVQIQGLPGQVFGRAAQLRLSRLFAGPLVGAEVAIAAARPPQRDAYLPDGQAGVRLVAPRWKALRTAGNAGMRTDTASLGLSGALRRFVVPELSDRPTVDVPVTGWGVSADVLLPLVPGTMEDRANALTLTGSFVAGAGVADLFSALTGGVGFPTLPNPGGAVPAPTYSPGLDPGLVGLAGARQMHAVEWRAVLAGLQYYLPPSGRVWIVLNTSYLDSPNAEDFGAGSRVFKTSNFLDACLHWEITPALRVGLEYAWFRQIYADGIVAIQQRVVLSPLFVF